MHIAPDTKTRDTSGRLKTFPLGSRTRTLSYDNLGNITGWSDSASEHYERFGYDALNRLTRFERRKRIQEGDDAVLQSQRFGYDANGNRLERQDGGTETVYSLLENSNRLMQVNQTDYRYDANGNIIDDGEHSYTYDARNRLIGVDGAISYLYNANNMRVRKSTPQGAVLYAWDNDRILGEYDQSGNPVQETVYLGSTPVALLKDDQTYRIHADQIDTPRVITDEAGTPLWEWESKPFGETRPDEDVDGDGTALSYNLRFPGQYYDAETGLHYNFNRDYDPATGRYVQSDPIGLRGGINTYSYVDQNPLIRIDSTGLVPCDGKWKRIRWVRDPFSVFTLKCTCYWSCFSCPESGLGDMFPVPNPGQFSTKGTIVFIPRQGREGGELESGNECICGKPGAERNCGPC